ncbi:MAG: glycosyltransferase [Planctomycetes bacterium]|nr:glycosyltransferase [Planctomycetota bacterium]
MTTANDNKPVRILQVVGNMNMGGIETGLMHLLRNLDNNYFQMDFLYVAPERKCFYDEEIRQLGAKIFPCSKWHLWSFRRKFTAILNTHGPYEVVHAHLYRFNGYVLKLAYAAGIPLRIAHSYNDPPPYTSFIGRQYQRLEQTWILRYANLKLAVSAKAAASLYGKDWQNDPTAHVLQQCRDFSPFAVDLNREQFRRALGIPEGCLVLGNVGRFHPQKNHTFLLKIAAEVITRHPNSRLMLVGDGELRTKITEQARALGILDKIMFMGIRSDVPELMMGAMDVFMLPSLYEGLGMVTVEAQAAGLPCVISDELTPESDLVKALVTRLSLRQPAGDWAEVVLRLHQEGVPVTPREAFSAIQNSDFNVTRHIRLLTNFYKNKSISSSPAGAPTTGEVLPSAQKANPARILQVVGNMNMGGIETSLMHILRNLDKNYFHMDFLYVNPKGKCFYDEEIRRLGASIFPCSKWRIWSFRKRFRKILEQHGPYDIVHAHLFRFNGYILKVADAAGVPLRIAHSHNEAPPYSSFIGRKYQQLEQKWILRHANLKLAISGKAAASLYGKDWQEVPHMHVLHQCRDFSSFEMKPNRKQVREPLGIPEGCLVLGNVARFHPQKNHLFLLEIFAEVLKRHPNSRLLLVGDGALRGKITEKAKALGILDKIIFLGVLKDVSELMLGALDVFVFPSLYEGLGMVVAEAQAAGLPCVISEVIPAEIDIVKPLITRLSLEQSAAQWAEKILRQTREGVSVSHSEALEIIIDSDFNVKKHIRLLTTLYNNQSIADLPERTPTSRYVLKPAQKTRPVRILQVVGGMDVGGIETNLMQVLRNLDSNRFRMDFLYVNTTARSHFDAEIKARGCRIFYCRKMRFWTFGRKFRRVLDKHGPYDIVHSHLFRFNGYVLRLAQFSGIPVRIAHSHSDAPPYKNPLLRLYQNIQRRWIWRYATHGLAVSANAANALFGPEWKNDHRFSLIYFGIPLKPFHQEVNRQQVRQELGIPADTLVIGHVGRFVAVKNHKFLLEVFAEILPLHPQSLLLLVGEGELQEKIKDQAKVLGIVDKVIFTGLRFDIARLLLGAMDVFVFPSLYEGLSGSLGEAQAAGLPCIISSAIPHDVDLVKPLLTRLDLAQSATEWAKTVVGVYRQKPSITRKEALAIMQKSHLNIDSQVLAIEDIYLGKEYSLVSTGASNEF